MNCKPAHVPSNRSIHQGTPITNVSFKVLVYNDELKILYKDRIFKYRLSGSEEATEFDAGLMDGPFELPINLYCTQEEAEPAQYDDWRCGMEPWELDAEEDIPDDDTIF